MPSHGAYEPRKILWFVKQFWKHDRNGMIEAWRDHFQDKDFGYSQYKWLKGRYTMEVQWGAVANFPPFLGARPGGEGTRDYEAPTIPAVPPPKNVKHPRRTSGILPTASSPLGSAMRRHVLGLYNGTLTAPGPTANPPRFTPSAPSSGFTAPSTRQLDFTRAPATSRGGLAYNTGFAPGYQSSSRIDPAILGAPPPLLGTSKRPRPSTSDSDDEHKASPPHKRQALAPARSRLPAMDSSFSPFPAGIRANSMLAGPNPLNPAALDLPAINRPTTLRYQDYMTTPIVKEDGDGGYPFRGPETNGFDEGSATSRSTPRVAGSPHPPLLPQPQQQQQQSFEAGAGRMGGHQWNGTYYYHNNNHHHPKDDEDVGAWDPSTGGDAPWLPEHMRAEVEAAFAAADPADILRAYMEVHTGPPAAPITPSSPFPLTGAVATEAGDDDDVGGGVLLEPCGSIYSSLDGLGLEDEYDDYLDDDEGEEDYYDEYDYGLPELEEDDEEEEEEEATPTFADIMSELAANDMAYLNDVDMGDDEAGFTTPPQSQSQPLGSSSIGVGVEEGMLDPRLATLSSPAAPAPPAIIVGHSSRGAAGPLSPASRQHALERLGLGLGGAAPLSYDGYGWWSAGGPHGWCALGGPHRHNPDGSLTYRSYGDALLACLAGGASYHASTGGAAAAEEEEEEEEEEKEVVGVEVTQTGEEVHEREQEQPRRHHHHHHHHVGGGSDDKDNDAPFAHRAATATTTTTTTTTTTPVVQVVAPTPENLDFLLGEQSAAIGFEEEADGAW